MSASHQHDNTTVSLGSDVAGKDTVVTAGYGIPSLVDSTPSADDHHGSQAEPENPPYGVTTPRKVLEDKGKYLAMDPNSTSSGSGQPSNDNLASMAQSTEALDDPRGLRRSVGSSSNMRRSAAESAPVSSSTDQVSSPDEVEVASSSTPGTHIPNSLTVSVVRSVTLAPGESRTIDDLVLSNTLGEIYVTKNGAKEAEWVAPGDKKVYKERTISVKRTDNQSLSQAAGILFRRMMGSE